MPPKPGLAAIAQAIADPLRVALLQHLAGGPAAVSELLSATGAAQSKVSNHLALLRSRKLVRSTRLGRQLVYELANPAVAELIEAMAAFAGAPPARTVKSAPLLRARTCYDHLAGKLGVALFDALAERGAISAPPAAARIGVAVALATRAGEIFGRLGVNLEAARRAQRRFAYACIDWTERRPHLGGALGAELYFSLLERGWVARRPGTRVVTLTAGGRRALGQSLGIRSARLA